jgi:glucose-6-phosphate 1-dehydrogenase
MDSMTFILFGATGDLAKRKIYPALYNLFIDQKMPQSFSIIGIGRREVSDVEFQTRVEQSLDTFSRRFVDNQSRVKEFISAFRYCQLDTTNTEGYRDLLALVKRRETELNIPENRMFYLSVAPELFDVVASNIKESGLGSTKGWKRLIIEKPFGHDLKSAQELNEKLSKSFTEDEIYRIDHYLGKPMVQNLEALEFSNPIFQALWNNHYIANIQITASETVGVEERAGYYDQAGAIRDMVQNHMLQMIMMVAMHLPKRISANEIREEKRKIMESLRLLNKRDVYLSVVRGQYESGEMNGQQMAGYTQEPGVAESSQTDTFMAARLLFDDPFWSGVPFYIRTGKRMKEKSTRIVVEFKNPLKGLYQSEQANLLVIEIAPYEGISLQLNSKNLENGAGLESIHVDYMAIQKDIPEAYERLIFDALRGDSTFFAHWDEVELSWQWVQPILEAFEENLLPLYHYEAGSYGPQAAHRLLEQDGFKWWLDKESLKTLELTSKS